MGIVRQFFKSRSGARQQGSLGTIDGDLKSKLKKTYRRSDLDAFDAYYEGRAYDNLADWNAIDADDCPLPLRHRKPKIQYAFAKVLASRIATKLVGKRNFPEFKNDDQNVEDFIAAIINMSKLKAEIIEPIRRMLVSGACFIRYHLVEGMFKIEHYLSKWCYPTFTDAGILTDVMIKYVYDDKSDLDKEGKAKKKWYRLDIGQFKDVLYDNPEYISEEEPDFKEVNSVEHNLGFVQGEWFTTCTNVNNYDGFSIIKDVLSFIDELNYSLSQSSDAVAYNQDPQLIFKNMDEDEIDTLMRSAKKGWNLGKNGEASLLEASMSGAEMAIEFRNKIRQNVQDIARVVLLDQERIVGTAQSGKAMELMNAPMIELVEELQPQLEDNLKSLVLKMAFTVLILNNQGIPVPINIPEGFAPDNLDVKLLWPEIFSKTMSDLAEKVKVASMAAGANLISRKTLTVWLAKDFGVVNVDEEVAEIAAQPSLSPFGMF